MEIFQSFSDNIKKYEESHQLEEEAKKLMTDSQKKLKKTTILSYLTQIRKKIKEETQDEKLKIATLGILSFSKEELQVMKQNTDAKRIEKNISTEKVEKFISKISSKTVDTIDKYDFILFLLLVSGRRTAEIVKTAKFSLLEHEEAQTDDKKEKLQEEKLQEEKLQEEESQGEEKEDVQEKKEKEKICDQTAIQERSDQNEKIKPFKIIFEGQVKLKSRPSIKYQILTLIEAKKFLKYFNYFRNRFNPPTSIQEVNKLHSVLNNRVKKIFDDTIKVHDLRRTYAELAFAKFNIPEKKEDFFRDLLGHAEQTNSSTKCYLNMKTY
jgi:integrase